MPELFDSAFVVIPALAVSATEEQKILLDNLTEMLQKSISNWINKNLAEKAGKPEFYAFKLEVRLNQLLNGKQTGWNTSGFANPQFLIPNENLLAASQELSHPETLMYQRSDVIGSTATMDLDLSIEVCNI